MGEEQILYDLIVHEEWEQEPQLLDQVENYFWQYRGSLLKKLWKVSQSSAVYMLETLKTQFRYQTTFGCPPIYFINLMNRCLPWMVALSKDASLLAILEDSVIEIRTSENYEQIISKCKVGKDAFPTWRKLVWNDDNTLLCYSNSFGDITIFDVTGVQKHDIPSTRSAKLKVPGTLSLAVTFLKFISSPNNGSTINHLYVCTYQGLLNVYKVSDTDYKHVWTYSFVSYHPYGIASMVHDWKNNLLIAAGNYGKEPFPNVMGDECYGSHCAISVWRFLNDTPFLSLVEDKGKALKKVSRRDWLKNLVLRRGNEQTEMLKHGIFRIKLSHDGNQIVTLHLDGRITFWSVPSMKLIRTWNKSEQPDSGAAATDGGFMQDAQRNEDISKTSNVVNLNWWSNQEMVLVSGNGNLTISSCETLTNLLGESAEKFDPWPNLSQVVDGSILVLECEKRVNDPSNKSKIPSKKWLAEDEEEMDSLRYRFKELSKQMLYFLTEAERFLPAVKPPRVLTNVYRLLCLKSTTPEELYARKINLEHYGDALDLAKRFDLNTDLVYQRQWRNKRVTKITIHDYLSKVKDREWVLDECVLRVPDDFDSTEHLLKYGLLGTSWEVLQRIDEKGSDKLPFNLESDQHSEHAHEEEVVEKTFIGELSTKQKRLCKYRRQLLHYLDRLSTYEVILGGSFKARDKFSEEYFSKFRSCNIVHQAIENARDEDAYSLEHLFSYHGKQLLPYWLPILSNFPETADIRYFEQVIPELGEPPEDPEILPWLEKHHREPDWVEQQTILIQIKDENENDLGKFIFDQQPDLRKFYKCETKKQLKNWFLHRVHCIDKMSGQIDKCCELLNVGIQRGLPELEDLYKEFDIWRTLVYDVGIESKMVMKDVLQLKDESKMKLLMSKSSEETFVKDFEKFLLPFLKNVGKKNYQKRQGLLLEFLVEIAKTDLTCCLKLFEKCSPELPEPLLPDIGEIMKIGIACIYACKRNDQLNHCFGIVECMPSREEGVISRQIEELHVKLDVLEHLLTGAEVLQHYNNPHTISEIAEIKSDSEATKKIFHLLVKNMVSKGKCSLGELNKLLGHMVKMSKEVFKVIDMKTTHQIFVEGLLRSGSKKNILLAEELITPSKIGGLAKKHEHHLTSAMYLLKYEVSVNVVLEAAKEYFDSAMSLSDSSMELSKLCLSLIKDTPSVIQNELDLISSLYLLNEYNVSMLPLQVRLCPDKLEIIDLCLNEKKNGYKKKDKLQQLSDLLQICGNDVKERTGQVHIKIAESAFDHKDYTSAGIMCVQLVEENYAPAWWICRKLGECSKYTNYTIRKKLLSFALTYCPLHHIEDILSEKTSLETQILYERLSMHMKVDEKKVPDEKEQTDGNTSSILSKTTTKTKKLISSVADTRWIGNAMNWVTSGAGDKNNSNRVEREIESMLHHPFYESLDVEKKETRKFNFAELSDYLRCVTDETKVFNQLLLRSQKLSEHRSEGLDLPNTDPAMLSLCEFAYNEESCLCLAYMMATSQVTDVQAVHDKHRKNTFTFLFAAYFYALQMYMKKNKVEHKKGKAQIYDVSPKEVIGWMLGVLGRGKSTNEKKGDVTAELFLSNINKLQDLTQAKMLKALDKGVDVGRFAVDDEYKRETILGLAMSLEDELINTSLLLADKYEIPAWEVMLSHVEFLFTDSGLKAKAIRESLTKWKVEGYLKRHGDEVFERLKKYVYPEINGKDHNALLLFYVFLLNCSSASMILEGTLTLDAHSKLLKKIKAAAPNINYKQLVHGNFPLDVIRDCVDDTNVHLLAKIAAKIPQAGGTYLSANKVFLANAIRMFWKKGENKDWLSQFENCKQSFSKLEIEDIVTFADQITFTDEAFVSLTRDWRCDISNRIVKYLRQQKGQEEAKQVASDDFDDLMKRYNSGIEHVDVSLQHLKTLNEDVYKRMFDSSQESLKDFAKRYDLSRGEKSILEELFRDLFLSLQPLAMIAGLQKLCVTTVNIKQSFQDSLKVLLNEVQVHKDFSTLGELTQNVEKHYESNPSTSIVNANDLLEVVRPFCSDVTVSTEIKSRVLNILQESVNLGDDDVMLLLLYQSQSIVGPAWGLEISDQDVDNEESRIKLFDKLLSMTTNMEQTTGLQKLLSSWPFNSEEADDNSPWIRLVRKIIEFGECNQIMKVLQKAKQKTQLTKEAYQTVYSELLEKKRTTLSCKWMLSSDCVECYDVLLKDLTDDDKINGAEETDVDDELLSLIISTKTLHRFTETPFYPAVITKLTTKTDDKKDVKSAVAQLRNNGFESEAGYIVMKTKQMNSSFYNLNNALDILNFKFRS